MVLAPSGFPSGCLAFLQLPRHSQLWHLHPSLASAMEPCGLRCILSIETLASIVARVSSVKLSDLNMEQTLVSATVCSCCWRRQGFSCVCCLYGLQSHQTWLGLCICGLCYAQKTVSGVFVTCWMQHDVNTGLFNWNSWLLQNWLYFSHKRSTCVQQFAVSCSCTLVPLTILHYITHLPYLVVFFQHYSNFPWLLLCTADGRSIYCAFYCPYCCCDYRPCGCQCEGQTELFQSIAGVWPDEATACYPGPALLSVWCQGVCIQSRSVACVFAFIRDIKRYNPVRAPSNDYLHCWLICWISFSINQLVVWSVKC